MQHDFKVKRLTGLFESCNHCGLPTVNCICGKPAKLTTKAQFWILSSKREFIRPSNTARVLKLINPASTKVFLWERTKPPEELVSLIKQNSYDPYILFPAEAKELKSREVEFKPREKIPAFILLDGTWKEARKILRKSNYLKDLPLLTLRTEFKSSFNLRRGAQEGNLCTIEAAIEILKLNKEKDEATLIEDFYQLFLRSFKAGASGHELKE